MTATEKNYQKIMATAPEGTDPGMHLYRTMERLGYLKSALVGQWFCARKGCAALEVYRIEGTHFAHNPRYRMAPGKLAAVTHPAARERNMEDDYWKARFIDLSFFDGLEGMGLLELRCSHLDERIPLVDGLAQIASATPGKPFKTSV